MSKIYNIDIEALKNTITEMINVSAEDKEIFPLEEVYCDFVTGLEELIRGENTILLRLERKKIIDSMSDNGRI